MGAVLVFGLIREISTARQRKASSRVGKLMRLPEEECELWESVTTGCLQCKQRRTEKHDGRTGI